MKKTKFISPICDHCGQSTQYAVHLDKGTSFIVLALYNAVRYKNQNRVHLRDEMECQKSDFSTFADMVSAGRMTSVMIDNVLRAKYHGLVAQLEGGGRGEYLMTPKGAGFLRGMRIPLTAIVDKKTHTKAYYLNPETNTTTFSELMRKEVPFWDIAFPDLDIVAPADDRQTLFTGAQF